MPCTFFLCDCPPEPATVTAMDRPVPWMTLPELRDELERTRPAWETTDLDGVLADDQFPVFEPGCPRSPAGRTAAATEQHLTSAECLMTPGTH
jgi:hypothetical protein